MRQFLTARFIRDRFISCHNITNDDQWNADDYVVVDDDDDDDDDETQGGFRLELMTYDADGNVSMTYNLTSPADGYIGANNIT